MDDTLVVPRVDMRPPRTRRLTTQFAPERKPAVWPWLLAIAAFVALAAVAEPLDPVRAQRLDTQADKVIELLP
jgi:predicted lysophospholipase L1 biosynthesis ABC-type transport system permease subunit